MPVLDEVLAANETYAASFGDRDELTLPPAGQLSELLASSLETAALGPDGFYDVGAGPGSPPGGEPDELLRTDIRHADPE